MESNQTGNENTAVGSQALEDSTGSSNTAVGKNALIYTTGALNTAVGSRTLDANTTASYNTAVGYDALGANTTADSNTALGYQAGAALTTGANNVVIGYRAGDYGTSMVGAAQNVVIGNLCHTPATGSASQIIMGYNVAGNANSSFCFGDSGTDSAIAFGATTITAPSDLRMKEDIEDAEAGLEFINALRPITYRWKKQKDIPEELNAYKADSEERTMNGKYNHGFIAQEVKEAIENHPEIKDGFDMWSEDDADGRQRIGEGALVPMLVKSIQELSAKVEDLENK